MTGFTLEAWSWIAIFVIFGGFLIASAYIFENWPRENPLDRRSQAHPLVGDYLPLRSPVEPVTGSSVPPVRASDGMAGSIGDPRGPSVSVVPD